MWKRQRITNNIRVKSGCTGLTFSICFGLFSVSFSFYLSAFLFFAFSLSPLGGR